MIEYFKALPAWQRYAAYLAVIVLLGLMWYFGSDELTPFNS